MASASIGNSPPQFGGWQSNFYKEGVGTPAPSDQPNADSEVVAPDYFATLQIPIIRGRALDRHDTENAPLAVVIDQTTAERIFPGQDPLGKKISSVPGGNDEENRWFEIVGVAARVRFRGFDDPTALPALYFSQAQVDRTGQVLLVRSSVGRAALEKSIREIVSTVDPTQPVFDVRTMLERVGETWAGPRLLTFLLTIFAGLALLLATIGLYGVISYSVLRRRREIGVRLAVGAQRSDIGRLIVGQGARLLALGLMIGLAATLFSARLLRSVLFEVNATDPVIYLGVSFLLAAAALLACWLPARRAARVDPMITLRAE